VSQPKDKEWLVSEGGEACGLTFCQTFCYDDNTLNQEVDSLRIVTVLTSLAHLLS
jgi:hypothetical protein